MAFRRRRRRPLVTWLPTLGAEFNEAGHNSVNGFTFALAVPGLHTSANSASSSLTFDVPTSVFNVLSGQVSLADFDQSSYRLRRIVGKIFAGFSQRAPAAQQTRAPAVLFGAGFMVQVVNDRTGVPLNQLDVLAKEEITDPWIWRRTWVLSNGNSPGDGSELDDIFHNFPQSTAEYGSVLDGGHIDAKTARVIGPEQRLQLVLSVKSLPLLTDYTEDSNVAGYIDYRILASMRKATNRRNAAR